MVVIPSGRDFPEIRPPVFIAIIVATVLRVGVIGYKLIAANTPPPRTDAAAQELQAAVERGRQQKLGGSKGMMPPLALIHP